jgi:O-antigen/teichoic acid export membrane protein
MRPWAWAVAQQAGRQSASYLVFVVLALLLTPHDFGVVSLAASWVALLSVFGELGFGAALVQRSEIRPGHLSTTFVLNLGAGAVLTLVGVAIAGPLARFFHAPEAAPVLAVLSAGFILNAPSLTQAALAQRELRFRQLALRDTASAVVGGVTGILLALAGWGVWSLVAQTLTTTVVGTALLWRLSPWRPHLSEVSLERAGELWGYSSKIFWFNVFKYFAQNCDRLLVGYLAGPVLLGVYTFAYRLVVSPVATSIGAIGNYLFPRFARLQHDRSGVREVYLRTTGAAMSVLLPVLALAVVTAPAAVPVLFGSRWAGSVILIQLFTLVAAAQLLISPAGQLMKALGRPGWMFGWSVFFTAVILLLLATGSAWGIEGIGSGLALAHIIGIGVAGTLITRLIGARWTDLGRAAIPGLALAIGSGGIALVVLRFLPAPGWLRLAMAAAAGVLVTALGVRRLSPAVWGAVTSGFGSKRRDAGVPGDGMLESITSERRP